MTPVPPTSVAKTSSYLGIIKCNYKGWGWTYDYWLNTNDRNAGISRLEATADELKFLIPIQAEIYDAVVHMGDSDIDGVPAITSPKASRAIDIISPLAPGEAAVDDRGWEPNDQNSAIYTRIDTASFSGKLFWRLPPDQYVSGASWVGPTVDYVQETTVEPTFTANPSASVTKVAGTYVERLRHYYWRMATVHVNLWKQDPDNADNYLISPMKYVYKRRPTTFKMGRAFLPSQRR